MALLSTIRMLWRGLPRFALGLFLGLLGGFLGCIYMLTRAGTIAGYLYGLTIFAVIGGAVGAVLIPRRKDLNAMALWRAERDQALAGYDAAVDELTELNKRADGPAIIGPEQASIVITATADQVRAAPGGGLQLVPACEPDCGICGGSGLCPGRTVEVQTPVDITTKFRRPDDGGDGEGRERAHA